MRAFAGAGWPEHDRVTHVADVQIQTKRRVTFGDALHQGWSERRIHWTRRLFFPGPDRARWEQVSEISPELAVLAWSVAIPPGWPVFHAISKSRASGPLTSPTRIRSGRMRNEVRKSLVIVTSAVVWKSTALRAAHWISPVSSMITMRSVGQEQVIS